MHFKKSTFPLALLILCSSSLAVNEKTLSQLLKEKAVESSQKAPAEKQAIMQKAIDDLKASHILEKALKVGDTAPDFLLPDVKAGKVSSKEILKKGPMVLTFYRGGWCPYCNLQLHALQTALPKFQKLGAELVAISPQTPDNSLSTAQKAGLSFYVLSDQGGKVAKQFGIVFKLPPELKQLYVEFGLDLAKSNGTTEWELPIAATYVINSKGKITYAFLDVDYKKRADPIDILKALQQDISGTSK